MVKLKETIRKPYVQRCCWLILFIILWEVIALTGHYSANIFPSFHAICIALVKELLAGKLILQVLYSLKVILLSMIIAFVIAVILSFFSIKFKVIQSLLDTLVILAHPLPGVALMPLIILWIGTGEAGIMVVVIHAILWPLVVNMNSGFKATESVYIAYGRNLELSSWQIFRHILLPSSMGYLLAGTRISWSRAWRGLISAEMIFGAMNMIGGIGWYYFEKRIYMDTAGMYAGLLTIIAVGFCVEHLLFNQIEKRTVEKWGMANNGLH